MKINPGEFKYQIEIVNKVKQKNENGFDTTTDYLVIRRCKAKITGISVMESIKGNADTSTEVLRFLTRYVKNHGTRKDVIRYRNNFYEIEYINNINQENRYLEYQGKKVSL